MSFLEPVAGEAFMFRVLKHHVANPTLRWVNTYEVRNRTATGPADLLTAAMAFAAFEAALHFNVVEFEYVTVSTWVPDGEPYNPDSFVSSPIGGLGERQPASEMLGLVNCWKTQKQVDSGRMGFQLYRGCLTESDVAAPAGITILSNAANMNTILSSAVNDNIGLFLGEATGIVQLVMESLNSSRNVVAFNSTGVTVKKLNNKYFNRTSP